MNQTKRILNDFQDVKFHRVIPKGWFQPKDLDWKNNLNTLTIQEFLDKFALEKKISSNFLQSLSDHLFNDFNGLNQYFYRVYS